jgi:CheY-like chemotaxis protein
MVMGTFTASGRDRGCLRGLRVLVVDDDEDVRDAVIAILSFFGADGLAVETADEARTRLAACNFDVLLSDIEMPSESGYDFIRSVRRSCAARGIAAAAVTGRASNDDCRAALAAGFDLVVGKPLEAAALVDAVRALAALSRLTG